MGGHTHSHALKLRLIPVQRAEILFFSKHLSTPEMVQNHLDFFFFARRLPEGYWNWKGVLLECHGKHSSTDPCNDSSDSKAICQFGADRLSGRDSHLEKVTDGPARVRHLSVNVSFTIMACTGDVQGRRGTESTNRQQNNVC